MTTVRRTVAAAIAAATLSAVLAGAAQARAAARAFDSITFRDSGGFTGGGTGRSLIVSRDGRVEAKTRAGTPVTLQLPEQELAALTEAVAAVDWRAIASRYQTPGASDLVYLDLTIVIGGETFATHADELARLPPALRELLARLDVLYRRATAPAKR